MNHHGSSGAPRIAAAVLAMLCCALTFTGCKNREAEKVKKSWDEYVAATRANDGQRVVQHLNASTLAMYERIRTNALESDAATVKALPMIEKIMVLMTRAQVEPAYLRQLNGGQLLMVGMRDGWMKSAGDPRGITLGDIHVNGDHANGALMYRGEEAPFTCDFTKEDGMWKHDLASLMSEFEKMMQDEMSKSPLPGMSIDDFIPAMISMQTGKKVGPEIWDKPKSK